MAWLTRRQYYVLGFNDEGIKIREEARGMSEEELRKVLDDYFGSSFSKVREGEEFIKPEEFNFDYGSEKSGMLDDGSLKKEHTIGSGYGNAGKDNFNVDELEGFKKRMNQEFNKIIFGDNKEMMEKVISNLSEGGYNFKDRGVAIQNLKNVVGSDELTPENINKYVDELTDRQNKYVEKYGSLVLSKDEIDEKVDEIMDEQSMKRQIKYDKICYISLGNAGSGKSTAGGESFLSQYGAYEVDADECKKKIPQFWGDNPLAKNPAHPETLSSIHNASSGMNDNFFDKAIEQGANIFLPKTGKSYNSLVKDIKKLKDAGYKVNLGFVDLDLKENFSRTIVRGLVTGRYTNASVMKSTYGINKEVFDMLVSNNVVDSWGYYNNGKLQKSSGNFLRG